MFPKAMLSPSAPLFFPLLILLLTACQAAVIDPKKMEQFCRGIEVGGDYEKLALVLPNQGMQEQARAPEATEEITQTVSNPLTVDGAFISATGLSSSSAPSCLVYFSSKLLGGDGKIIYKKFVSERVVTP
jgi:hypothetical protein